MSSGHLDMGELAPKLLIAKSSVPRLVDSGGSGDAGLNWSERSDLRAPASERCRRRSRQLIACLFSRKSKCTYIIPANKTG